MRKVVCVEQQRPFIPNRWFSDSVGVCGGLWRGFDSPPPPHPRLFPSDALCSGQTDERVLVPEPLCKADGTAHQEDPGQDPQLSGEGQRVLRGASEAAGRHGRPWQVVRGQAEDQNNVPAATQPPHLWLPSTHIYLNMFELTHRLLLRKIGGNIVLKHPLRPGRLRVLLSSLLLQDNHNLLIQLYKTHRSY